MAHIDISKLALADWSATELAAALSKDNVRALLPNFDILEQGVRARILISTALLPETTRNELKAELQVYI